MNLPARLAPPMRQPLPARGSGAAIRALVLWVILALAPSLASAHAQLHGTDPADGSLLGTLPQSVTLTFSEGVAPLVLRWIAPDGSTTEAGAVSRDSRLTVTAPPDSGQGSYLLSWRVASADGHPVGGVLTLHLGVASAQAGALGGQGAARATAAARFGLSVTMIAAVGAALHGAFVARSAPGAGLRRYGLCSAASALGLALAFLGLHGLDLLSLPPEALMTGAPWQAALSAPLARTAGLSALAALLAALALNGEGRPRLLATGSWAVAALSFAASGHAVTAPPVALSTVAMILHGAALVWWMGLLVPLAGDLRHPDANPRLARFSAFAVPLVAGLVLSGGWLTWAQTGGDGAMALQSAWGAILGVKLLLVAALLGLAALNRVRLTPALRRTGDARPLARSIRAELVLGLLILALAAGFRLTPPFRALTPPAPPVMAHIHTPRAMADLRLSPGQSGPVTVEMAFQTGDFLPLDPREVSVALRPADGRLEPIRAPAAPAAEGIWRTPTLTLPFGGAWEITLHVLVTDFESLSLSEILTLPE